MLAQIYLTGGDAGKAVAEAEQALVTSQSEPILYLSAAVFMEAGREAQALKLASELGARLEPEPQIFAKLIEGQIHLKHGEVQRGVAIFREAQSLLDTWLGRFHLGRAYVEAGAFTEAHSELEICLKRRGEATSVFFDDVPSYHFLPPVYYYFGRAQEGLGSSGAADSYETFLSIKQKGGDQDPLVADARRRLASLR